ncbi:MAG: hypothetical protein MUF51_08645 [Vicinamibacteria bacterium]|jgi:hypothetical protein|nr:hypothetical protein [Vicinamibacteria bacterium]
MILGLPGTGIGGMFYVISALLLMMRSVARRLLGRVPQGDHRAAWRLGALTFGILLGIFVTGFLLGVIFVPFQAVTGTEEGASVFSPWMPLDRNAVRVGALLFSTAILLLVLLSVECLRLVCARSRAQRAEPHASSNSPEEVAP